ncbi:MAG: shikimate dehydrogenase [Bacillota bacterium]|nr:shikimate dehydrogenase [Bacillota bacterium]
MVITRPTKVFALFGDPVAHSLSPVMQNRAFAYHGLPFCYIPFRVRREDLNAAVVAIRALGLGGVNITIPHKEQVIPYLDEVDREARLIGAVNTILNQNGRLIGYNTDGAGFLLSLNAEINFTPGGKRVVLLGAGGGARAVAFSLALGGTRALAIFNRNLERAQVLAEDLRRATGCDVETGNLRDDFLYPALARADLLVHASPVGMYPHHEEAPLVKAELLPPGLVVCDLVYNPPKTRLIIEAEARGCRVLSGIGMLVYQGALAFEIWTGLRAPVEVMRAAVKENLHNFESAS